MLQYYLIITRSMMQLELSCRLDSKDSKILHTEIETVVLFFHWISFFFWVDGVKLDASWM